MLATICSGVNTMTGNIYMHNPPRLTPEVCLYKRLRDKPTETVERYKQNILSFMQRHPFITYLNMTYMYDRKLIAAELILKHRQKLNQLYLK